MSVKKIEALLDAMAKLNGMHNPETDAYQLRSPLLIRSFARPGKHDTDPQGRRIFTSFLAGYKAATFDMLLKLSGKSRAGLKSDDPLAALLRVYGIDHKAAHDNIVAFVRRALKDPTVSIDTPLSFFLE